MKYSLDKYKYHCFTDSKGAPTVVAVSTYAGRTVRGIAKCDPRDNYSLDEGKKLAAARCNAKISAKRMKRAYGKMIEAGRQLDEAQAYYERMRTYFNDASKESAFAVNEVDCLIKEM